eukprot:m.174499 g.174499  ORF g.174499 m.174499 type:complete len:563 (+) comp16539_c3_seq3:119-1807(+)
MTETMAEDDPTRKKQQKNNKKKDGWRKEIYTIIWVTLLVIATICHWWAYYFSDKWLVSQKPTDVTDPPEVRVGLLDYYRYHDAWLAVVILLGISLGCLTIATICAILFAFVRLKKAARMRHVCLKITKVFCFISALCMFVGMVIFPIGFESKKIAPCRYDITKEQMYHMCNPWETGLAVYVMIVAQICLTLAICFAGCIISQIDHDRKEQEKKRRQGKEDEWFDKYGTAPLMESKMGKNSDTASTDTTNPLDPVLVMHANEDMTLHMPGYLDVDEPEREQNQRARAPAASRGRDTGYLDLDEANDEKSPADLGDTGYLDFDEAPVATKHSQRETDIDAAYLDFNEDDTAVGKSNKGDDIDAAYLDFDEEEESSTVRKAATTTAQVASKATSKGDDIDGAYLDFTEDDAHMSKEMEKDTQDIDNAYLDFEAENEDDEEEDDDATDAGYLQFDDEPVQQHDDDDNAVDAAYLQFEEDPQAPRRQVSNELPSIMQGAITASNVEDNTVDLDALYGAEEMDVLDLDAMSPEEADGILDLDAMDDDEGDYTDVIAESALADISEHGL